jgi:hypothetical protein
MKPLALLAAAVGAIAVLAACSQSSQPAASQPSTSPTIRPAVLVNCPKLYDAWKTSPAEKVVAALAAVDSATVVGDVSAQVAALKQAASAVDSAGRYPLPACADPQGLWTALLMHVNAAAHSAGSAAGRASMTVALQAVPQLERELTAELKHTADASSAKS